MMQFENKVVVVTGGSRGIGKAAAILFAAEGASVIILSVNEGVAKDTVAEIESGGGKASFMKVDVANLKMVQAVGEEIMAKYSEVDVLVNNAGITKDSSLKNMTEEQFDSVISINLKGVFNCCKVFGLYMATRGRGVIINVSSIVVHYGNFGQTNYVASKAGVIGMTKTMARELGPKGVRVNAIAPGFVETEMLNKVPIHILNEIKDQIPLKRLADPEEIAATYLFLASDDAAYINGAVLNVDGGLVI